MNYSRLMYISENCQWIPYGTNPELDKQVDSDDWNVREAVAQQGYGLDKLVNDLNSGVLMEVARQGYGLDKLINDKNHWVREEVVKQGYRLDILVNDEDDMVRYEVAKQGYELDKLVNDKNEFVREAVYEYMMSEKVDDEQRKNFVNKHIDSLIKDMDRYKPLNLWAISNGIKLKQYYQYSKDEDYIRKAIIKKLEEMGLLEKD